VAHELNLHSAEEHAKVFETLVFLANGTPNIFDIRFDLWEEDSGEVLDIPAATFSAREIEEALEKGILHNPESGSKIEDFEKKIAPNFVVSQHARDMVAATK
jgi:hypothetical protein